MIDSHVHQLLEQAIDSPTKLHILLIFHENPQLEASATRMAERSCRDIWSVTQSLHEMAEDGILTTCHAKGDMHFRYRPQPERVEAIRSLVRGYDDPLEREVLHHVLRDIASYAPYRRTSGWERQMVAM